MRRMIRSRFGGNFREMPDFWIHSHFTDHILAILILTTHVFFMMKIFCLLSTLICVFDTVRARSIM
jgi:hypothetical protein